MTKNAKIGDKVKVHYTGKLNDGNIFDSSKGKDPLEFTIGNQQVLKKFEDTVDGLKIGETANVHIPAIEAYGIRQDNLVAKVPNTNLPENMNPEIGMRLQTKTSEGEVLIVKVIDVGENEVTLDANHELADQDLNFEIELVDII